MSTETAVRYASECCDEYKLYTTLSEEFPCDVSLTHTHLHWANSSVASAYYLFIIHSFIYLFIYLFIIYYLFICYLFIIYLFLFICYLLIINYYFLSLYLSTSCYFSFIYYLFFIIYYHFLYLFTYLFTYLLTYLCVRSVFYILNLCFCYLYC